MIYVYIKEGYKNLFGALYLTNNKFCTMGRSRREEKNCCCLCFTKHKRACTV